MAGMRRDPLRRDERLGTFLRRSAVAHLLVAAVVLTAGHMAPPRRPPLPTSVAVRLVEEGPAPKAAPPAVEKPAAEKAVAQPAPPPPPAPEPEPPPKPPEPPKKVAPPKPPPPAAKPPPPKAKPAPVKPKPTPPAKPLVNETEWEKDSLDRIRARLREREAETRKAAEEARVEKERQELAARIERIKAEEQQRIAAAQAAEQARIAAQQAEAARQARVAAERAAAEAAAQEGAMRRYDFYTRLVSGRIRGNYTLPPNVDPGAGLECKVRVRINLAGEIVSFVVESPSGNRYFDDAVSRAIKKSDPLPSPPNDLTLLDDFDGNAVELRFSFESDLL